MIRRGKMDEKHIPFCLFIMASFKLPLWLEPCYMPSSASFQHTEGETDVAEEREGGQMKGMQFPFSLFSSVSAEWREKPITFTMLILYFLSLSLYKMAQSCYSPMNTGKTVPHLLFSPHFRHHLLTSPIARSPCFRCPSSYNYSFFSFPHCQGVKGCHTFQLLHAKSRHLSKAFVTLYTHNDISWMIFLITRSLRSCCAKCYI